MPEGLFDAVLIAYFAVLAAFSVVGLFDYYTWTYTAGRVWAWLAIGLWAVAYRSAWMIASRPSEWQPTPALPVRREEAAVRA